MRPQSVTQVITLGRQTFNGYLIHNWQENDVRVLKTKPETSPYEVVRPIKHTVDVPEQDAAEISEKLEVPQAKVEHAIGEVVFDEDPISFEDGDFPAPIRFLTSTSQDAMDDYLEEDMPVTFEALDWLRNTYKEELAEQNRDVVLTTLEKHIQRVRDEVLSDG